MPDDLERFNFLSKLEFKRSYRKSDENGNNALKRNITSEEKTELDRLRTKLLQEIEEQGAFNVGPGFNIRNLKGFLKNRATP